MSGPWRGPASTLNRGARRSATMTRIVSVVITTRPPIRAPVAPGVHCDLFAPSATLIQHDTNVAAITVTPTRPPRRIERTRLTASGSDLWHRDTWTRTNPAARGTTNTANEQTAPHGSFSQRAC